MNCIADCFLFFWKFLSKCFLNFIFKFFQSAVAFCFVPIKTDNACIAESADVLPRVGEVARVVNMNRMTKVPVARLVTTLIAERFLDVIALVLFLIIRTFLVHTFVIISGSMEETLKMMVL